MSRHYGEIGKPVLLYEAYKDWRDEQLSIDEADTRADFPSFLYGPVRQSLWHGYTKAQPQFKRYTRTESVVDFRERRLRGLNGLKGLTYVGEHGEYENMRRTERPPATLVVDTYGAVYGITRHAIINDDSGDLLSRNPADMGYAAGVFVAETVAALIESNPNGPDGNPMASGGRGNYTTNPLSEDSLVTAITFMEDQLDDDGRHIVVRPSLLSVKNARLELIARRILRSQQTGAQAAYTGAAGAGTNVFDKGTLNMAAGILPEDGIVRDAYFTDSTDWRLYADPGDVPAWAVGFLNGQEAPFIGLKDPMVKNALGSGTDPYDYEFDSVDFKIRFDFGCAPVDPRGFYWGQVSGS